MYEIVVGKQPTVGRDLSPPPPIYRPVGTPPPIPTIVLKLMIAPTADLSASLAFRSPDEHAKKHDLPSSYSSSMTTAYTTCPESNAPDYREYTDESAAKPPPCESQNRNSLLAMQTTVSRPNDVYGRRWPP